MDFTKCSASKYWSIAERQAVRQAQAAGRNPEKAAKKATTAAIVRRLVKRGWKRRHTSKDRTGRAASRYLVRDGVQIRLSDHNQPAGKGATWTDVAVHPAGDVEAQILRIEGLRQRGQLKAGTEL